MIQSISVSNFRCLGSDVILGLSDLTVLVGRNGAGKSSLVDVLQFLSDCMRLGLEGAITKRHGIGAVRRWSSGHPHNVSIKLRTKREDFDAEYAFVIAGDREEEYRVQSEEAGVRMRGDAALGYSIREGKWIGGPEDLRPPVTSMNLILPLVAGDSRFKPLADELRRMAVYSIFPDFLREPQKYDPTRPMREHGENWISILKDQSESEWKSDLVSALSSLTGDIQDVRIRPVSGFLTTQFKHQANRVSRNKWFESSQESDGTLRVAGIITALLQTPPLTVVGVEEPELTVHPGAIRLLYDFLKQASRSSQVVLTTHSPDLLDHVDADDVRLVENKEGATTVGPMNEEQRQVVRDRLMSLGEIMRSEYLQMDLPLE
ncbi:MAG: AAA family ATPase [Deltaproteobacteria bacterium]|nr:AAA family ATPase [Deltaproteobacteria bacterium]